MLQVERDAVSILLSDWTHATSDTIYSQYFDTGAFPNCVDSILANGYGRVECLPDYILQAGPDLGMQGSMSSSSSSMGMSMGGMVERADTMSMQMSMPMSMIMATPTTSSMSMKASTMASMSQMASSMPMPTSLNARGCAPPMMFKPGYNLSSLPPESCTNTSAPLYTIQANDTDGWLALNLLNAGSVSKLAVSLDSHSMYVYAADGLYVTLQEIKASIQFPLSPLPANTNKAPRSSISRLDSVIR